MTPLPRLLVSSVVRGSRQGDSHGGLYLVDIEADRFEQKLDWNTSGIDFTGRGADRGLRGVAVMGSDVFVAASDELFVFDPDFRRLTSYRNAYLKHCHEICGHRGKLWLTSTGFDAVLRFDLASRVFDFGVGLSMADGRLNGATFDPCGTGGPAPANQFHINSVHASDAGIFLCGRRLPGLAQITQAGIAIVAPLPLGTHNARPFRGGVLFNDTESDCLTWIAREAHVSIPVPRIEVAYLSHTDFDESGLARQAFGRGLCELSDTLIAAGSSPTTVTIYDLARGAIVKSQTLTFDIRNAAHGLAVWPF